MKKEIIIRPPSGFVMLRPRELLEYRGLLASMVRRRIKTQFDRQYLAYIWPLFRPLLMVFLFSIFRNVSEAKIGVNIPYIPYVYSGLILWFMFTEAVSEASNSIKESSSLIKKVYFPRILAPVATVTANIYIFLLSFFPTVLMMIWYEVFPNWHIILLPLILLQISVLILGVGCLFASISVDNNDWEKFLSFALYIGIFVSPVIYSPAMLPHKYYIYYALNPLVGTLLAFRSCLFSEFPLPLVEWIYSCFFSTIIAIVGIAFFQKAEKNIVDRL